MNPLDYLYEAVGWVFTHIYYLLKPVFGPTSGWTWALSIVILVALMRLVMVPLFIKQMHTTRAMSSLQPQMAALRKKYKNDKQTLNQETMKLYQEAGVNPLMGCLPFVLQLPLFFGLFSVLRAIAAGTPKYGLPASMVDAGKQAKILGVSIADKVLFTHGLSVPLHSKIVIVGFVLVSMATTYLTIRQSMKRGMMPAATPDNPMASSQKYMAYIMPFFALTGLYWPFGLVLYWVTTNVWTLGQQFLLAKRYPYTPPAPVDGTVPASVSPAAARSLTAGTGRSNAVAARGQQGPARPGRAAANGSAAKGSAATGASTGAKGAASAKRGASATNAQGRSGRGAATPDGTGSGVLKRFSRGRAEPEPEPEPEVKIVRHQTQRQSRSKRSGKR
ncbi:MAG: membrane protein insertase YidC [Streptosporangiaceae bacterium]